MRICGVLLRDDRRAPRDTHARRRRRAGEAAIREHPKNSSGCGPAVDGNANFPNWTKFWAMLTRPATRALIGHALHIPARQMGC